MSDEVYKYGKHIVWSLPVAFQYEAVWGAIFRNFQDYCIDLPQVNGFGCPQCIWTGGRAPAIRSEIDKPMLLRIFNYLRSIKVTPSFTFTCTQLTEDDFKDKYANYLLDAAIEADSHFIIYDDRLRDYIKSRNPNAYTVASVIKPAMRFQGATKFEEPTVENETALYNQLLKEYDLVVVRPEYSKTVLLEQPDLIDDISRVEVLINQPCLNNCPRMPDHYRHLESFRIQSEEKKGRFKCARENLSFDQTLCNTLCHSDDVVRKLVEHGVKHLKLQGRGVGYSLHSVMSLLYAAMFNVDGPYNLPFTSLYQGQLMDKEFRKFQIEVLRINPDANQQPRR